MAQRGGEVIITRKVNGILILHAGTGSAASGAGTGWTLAGCAEPFKMNWRFPVSRPLNVGL